MLTEINEIGSDSKSAIMPTEYVLNLRGRTARLKDLLEEQLKLLEKQLKISKQADRDFPERKKAEVPA